MAAFHTRVPRAVAVCAVALAGALWWSCAAPPAAAADALELPWLTAWRARLVSPLKASFNRKGDVVSANVLDPPEFKGWVLEGQVREVRIGDRAHASYVEFEFLALHMGAKSMPVTAELVGVGNSRGQPGLDEDGRPLGSGVRGSTGKLNPGELPKRPGPPRLTVMAPELYFAPGSEFTLHVRSRKER